MKRIAASAAFALALLTGIAGASACDFMDSTAYYTPAPAPVVTAAERQMIMSYLDELSTELAA